MTKENECEQLAKAKALAINRGLPAERITCPIQDICKRNICVFLTDIDQLENDQSDPKYFKKQEDYDKG